MSESTKGMSTDPQCSLAALEGAFAFLGKMLLKAPKAEDVKMFERLVDQDLAYEYANDDDLASDHFRIFSQEVHPYESYFLEPDGKVGGALSHEVLTMFKTADFVRDEIDNELAADHLAFELLFLAYIYSQEAHATEMQKSDITEEWQDLEARFNDQHVMNWLIPVTVAIEAERHPLYSRIAAFIRDIAVDRASSVWQKIGYQPSPLKLAALPKEGKFLDDKETSLKDIAHFFLNPSWCGFYLSKGQIASIGRSLNLPTGFGTRKNLLENLINSGRDFDKLQVVLEGMRTTIAYWRDAYMTYTSLMPSKVEAWLERLDFSERILETMHAAGAEIPKT